MERKLVEEVALLQERITKLEKSEARHKHTEAALRRSQLHQQAILNNIPDIAWLKDKESRFIAVNDAFGRSCGVKPEDLTGKTDLDIWPHELAERYRFDDREVMESGQRKQVEEPLADKEGKVRWIETVKTPIFNEKSEVIGTTGIARDITERKKVEEVLRNSRAELAIRVKVRTAELAKANEELWKEIGERKKTEQALRESEAHCRQSIEKLSVEIANLKKKLKVRTK
ncbi:MAG TPA: PAS domain-containing protein [Patescibacteria group bacterium]|nr:PAS domain-containing protein [Patescibacteria group bacterium]